MSGNKVQEGRKLCGATRKAGGSCTQAAGWGTDHPGSGRCKLHGGASTGPKTEEGKKRVAANAVKHGAYMDRILDETERDIYDALHDHTVETYRLDVNNTMHMATLHRACMSYIKTLRLDEWEMTEEWLPYQEEKKKGKIVRDRKSGAPKLISRAVYNKAGEYVGEETGSLRRIRWASNAPSWETHFQKYMAILGTDRGTEIKNKQAGATAGKVVEALNWLWGGKSDNATDG